MHVYGWNRRLLHPFSNTSVTILCPLTRTWHILTWPAGHSTNQWQALGPALQRTTADYSRLQWVESGPCLVGACCTAQYSTGSKQRRRLAVKIWLTGLAHQTPTAPLTIIIIIILSGPLVRCAPRSLERQYSTSWPPATGHRPANCFDGGCNGGFQRAAMARSAAAVPPPSRPNPTPGNPFLSPPLSARNGSPKPSPLNTELAAGRPNHYESPQSPACMLRDTVCTVSVRA